MGDIVDAQDSEEFTWWEAEIVSKYGVDDGRVLDDDDNGEDGVKGEHLCDSTLAAKDATPDSAAGAGGRSQRAEDDQKDSSRRVTVGGGGSQNTLIKVHFLGWHVKWNQWIDLRKHPQRIQPRNSMVVAWRRYLRAGSPVEACINKEHLGDLPPGMTEITDPSPVIFGPGTYVGATRVRCCGRKQDVEDWILQDGSTKVRALFFDCRQVVSCNCA